MSADKLPRTQPFEIRDSPIQGRGAFATTRIRKGAVIAEYVGERIGNAEADRRYDEGVMKRHHTFLFIVNGKTVVDAALGGNDSRFINHKCDPNCETYIEKGRIFIEATKNVQPGTELGYDYLYDRTDEQKDQVGLEDYYICHCGSPKCRGTMLAPEKVRKKKRKPLSATKKRTKPSPKRKPAKKKSARRS